MKVRLSTLQRGNKFELGGMEWLVLKTENLECSTHPDAKKYWVETTQFCFASRFNDDYLNDWSQSKIRYYLHDEWLQQLVQRFPGLEYWLVPMKRDLTADDGLKTYGICTDRVTLLTADEYRASRDLYPLRGIVRWLITGESTSEGAGAEKACCVVHDGRIQPSRVDNIYYVFPVICLTEDTLVIVPDKPEEEDSEEPDRNDEFKARMRLASVLSRISERQSNIEHTLEECLSYLKTLCSEDDGDERG